MRDYTVLFLANTSIQLSFTEKRTFSNGYLSSREKCWQSEMKKHGNNLWNGDVYTIEDIQISTDQKKCKIHMGLCEYKDIMFKIKETPKKIVEQYGKKSLVKDAITTILPYTTDHTFLFGVVSSNTVQEPNALDQIGGTLNKNEQKIQNIEDIATYTITEIHEETGLHLDPSCLSLCSLSYYHSDCRYRFLYTYTLPHNSDYYSQIVVNNELSHVVFLTREELLNYSGPSTNRIPFCKKYIKQIVQHILSGEKHMKISY